MDATAADPSFGEAVTKLREAMSKLVTGDDSAIKELYSHGDDVTGFNGFGSYEKGFKEVAKRWDWAAKQFEGGWVTYENLSSYVSGDLGFTVDVETLHLAMNGRIDTVDRTNRVTHIFRREDGEWRLIHRHANRLEKKPA